MQLIISFLSLLVILTVIIILFYNQYQTKKYVEMKLEDIVSQINNASFYAYTFDKTQDENLQNIDSETVSLSETLKKLSVDVKSLEKNTKDLDDIRKSVHKHSNNIDIGNHRLASEGNEWLQVKFKQNNNGNEIAGGLSANKLLVSSSSVLKGNTNVDNLNVKNSINIKGGKSTFNPNGLDTIFPYSDGMNYIRGDTEVSGNTRISGDIIVNSDRSICIGTTCLTENILRDLKSLANTHR